MSDIRAFVGHSFTSGDAEVVRIFLDYLSTVQKSIPGFSWTHAEGAEPRLLRDKVLSLVGEANVFIGICTRKERAIDDANIVKFPFSAKVGADPARFEWKTSDWIIQEIGLAVGRELDVILLLEEGVRRPGGLQGDIEHISFSRAAPEKSFDKLLQMLSATLPLERATAISQGDPAPPQADDIASEASIERGEQAANLPAIAEDASEPEPASEWTFEQYERAYTWAQLRKMPEQVGTIGSAFERHNATTPGADIFWESMTTYSRLVFSDEGRLSDLELIAKRHPSSIYPQKYLARAFAYFDQHERAAKQYESLAERTTDLEAQDRGTHLGYAFVHRVAAGQMSEAFRIEENMRAGVAEGVVTESQLLTAYKTTEDLPELNGLKLLAMERIIDLEPLDTETIFSLAYAYSERGEDRASLFHYQSIPYSRRTPVTWNNLGVTLTRLSMPASGIDAYQAAAQRGETLAMSNIAEQYLSKGFIADAKRVIDEALSLPRYNKHVSATLAKLQEIEAKEAVTRDTILKEAEEQMLFRRCVGRHLSNMLSQDVNGIWIGPECDLVVEVDRGHIVLAGEFEREAAGLFGGKLSGKVAVEYRGQLHGGAAVCMLSRSDPNARSLLAGMAAEHEVLMWIDDVLGEIHVMETTTLEAAKFYTLVKRATPSPA